MYSQSAKKLSEAIGAKRIKSSGSTFVPRPDDIIFNWGSSERSGICTFNNNFNQLKTCTNKLEFFKFMKGHTRLPKFWTEKENIIDEDFPVVCRTNLTGHSGMGIVIADTRDDLVDCSLYVKYIPKKYEYRVHLGKLGHEVRTIAIQQKKRRLDCENPDWKIRNHANGFIYAREGVNPSIGVLDAAHDCFVRSGLDYGAVDVIWNDKNQQAYVLEINTAPGLEGQTLDDYASFFKELIYELE